MITASTIWNKPAWFFACILTCLPITAHSTAAKVEFAAGDVQTRGANGSLRSLSKGMEIDTGDTVLTNSNGRAQLRFSDGGYISLQPNTQFRVDEYKYEGKTDGNEKSHFSLIKGGLRAITGAIGHVNKTNYRVNTPVATIGIRGTEFLAQYNDKLLVKVGNGAIYMSNSNGDLVLFSGQSGEVSNENSKPEYSNEEPSVTAAGPKGNTPEEVQQQTRQEQQQVNTFQVAEQYNESGAACVVVGNCPITDSAAPSVFKTLNNQGIAIAHFDDEPGYELWGELEWALPGTIEFDATGRIIKIIGSEDGFSVSNITGDFLDTASDGALTWTRLNGGTVVVTGEEGARTANITNAHFIYGNPTSASDVSALHAQSATATYDLIGGTRPTDGYGNVGSLIAGGLGINFANYSIYGNIKVNVAGTEYHAVGYEGDVLPNGQFVIYGGDCSDCLYGVGFLAGPNAEQAAMSYAIAPNGASINDITGTAAFKKNTLVLTDTAR
ncbi:MAG TPA: FecR family protein [Methylophilaceae bacterium]|nr:FecR family protein [Methylophilaceae bacterium]